ncbi:MAG: PQQ-binding-like beta-propeller repeat protein [Candidatus Omnitrophica bacterium]|nr:PQQ-binding-like beta-propeller repeat protein [Candidatus Omnitrophota bacterium]
MFVVVILTLILSLGSLPVAAEGWPMFRADAARSGYTDQSLPEQLKLRWTYAARHAPRPAWQAHDTRMDFDHAYQTVLSDETVYFGSSADCKIYALDAGAGEEKWSFFTDGPVRFAPAIWKNRLFAVSDDGFLYCLDKNTGRLIWKKYGANEERRILGNDRMISKWAARGAPLVDNDTVYFAAGIWPSEGIFFHALDAESGAEKWTNEDSGDMEILQPHSAMSKSGASAQGYLAAGMGILLSPTGRAVPAAFDEQNGHFKYFHLNKYSPAGGCSIVVAGRGFFNGGKIFDLQTGELIQDLKAKDLVVIPGGAAALFDKKIVVYQWMDVEKIDRKGKKYTVRQLQETASMETENGGHAMIATNNLIIAGGSESIQTFRLSNQETTWRAAVQGIPKGLAVADGKLIVSTDQGMIYCFDEEGSKAPETIRADIDESPYGDSEKFAEQAETIIERSGVRHNGFCLDLGCGDGALAYELAKRTDLHIYAVDSDPEMVKTARRKLDAAGLYGVRVTVHQEDPRSMNYPDYFADLIVSSRSIQEGDSSLSIQEAERMQRPWGGVMMIGDASTCPVQVRGPLEKSDGWTHQYYNPANTLCSNDAVVQGPLGMLWYKDNTLRMAQRHGRPPAPLFHRGKMFIEGLDALRAVDAYNGRILWEHPLPGVLKQYDQDHLMGTAGTGSNFCIADDRLYLHTQDRCLCIDAGNGETIREYAVPDLPDGKAGTWGYIARAGNMLFGSLANTDHIVKWRYLQGDMSGQFTESRAFFAMDVETGKIKWRYDAKDSIRHNAVAIGSDAVYLIDRPLAEFDRIDFDAAKRRGETLQQRPGVLIALDRETGEERWRSEDDIFGTMLALSEAHDVLLMTCQPTRFSLSSEVNGRMAAFHASKGSRIWDIQADYASRPLINDKTIYAQPSAWNLLTGEKNEFEFSRSYGCGTLAGSKNMLVFRSGTLGYRDLQNDKELKNYGGIRSGCWIDILPAGGLVLLPNSANGCVCSYLIQASIALQPIQ